VQVALAVWAKHKPKTEAPEFYPYSSKFDYWLEGRA
jgi:hypothetical protein